MFVIPKLLMESEYVQSLVCHCPRASTSLCGIAYRTGSA